MQSSRVLLPGKVSALSRLNRILKGPQYADAKYFILLDSNCFTHCLPTLVSRVEALQKAEFLELPEREECKDLEIASQVWQTLMESGADRNTVLVNLGGGCISDLGGFVAAGYKRGIRYINVPTTLIGMVDAAIGGKTAVNVAGVKNQVGFFYHPDVVCIEPSFLSTLPDREVQSGWMEMLKVQLISGMPLDTNITEQTISDCVRFKMDVVKSDLKDHGIRRILNFGHTFGHAVEAYSHRLGHPLLHGEAVGVGMVCALYLSMQKLGLSSSFYQQVCKVVSEHVELPKYTLRDTEALLEYMRNDKKNENGEICCVLLQNLGVPVIDVAVPEVEIRDCLLKIAK